MTIADHEFVAGLAARLATDLPVNVIHDLANTLATLDVRDWAYVRLRVIEDIPPPRFHGLIDEFLAAWQERAPRTPPTSVALALLAATSAVERCRREQSVELVWTGPSTPSIPLRRTDQALLQVINAARQDLLVVSFAVYNIAAVVEALIDAGRRGVRIRICLEAPEPSGQRLAYNTIQALGDEVGHLAQLFIWPLVQRPAGASGKPASLHAKCAVADGRFLFISSANLTEYAMALNMELGVLIQGGDLPGRVDDHFRRLIENGVLRRVTS